MSHGNILKNLTDQGTKAEDISQKLKEANSNRRRRVSEINKILKEDEKQTASYIEKLRQSGMEDKELALLSEKNEQVSLFTQRVPH